MGNATPEKSHLKGFGHNLQTPFVDPSQTKLEILHSFPVPPALCLLGEPLAGLARQLRLNALRHRHPHEGSSCMDRGCNEKEWGTIHANNTPLRPCESPARFTVRQSVHGVFGEHHDRRASGRLTRFCGSSGSQKSVVRSQETLFGLASF